MRKDVYVRNDSGAYCLLSSSVLERVIDDSRENDGAFLKAHEAILGLLVGDDSFVGRVVVGEPLSSDESSQWIARFRWALKVPCGKLLVCGGYDPDVLGDWVENGQNGDFGGVGMVEVPPGHYLVDVYTYLHSMNGRVILEQMWDTKLGAWFRKDHPGRGFPSWVAGELTLFHDEDPGHEKEWEDLKQSVERGALKVETQPLDWVTFLFHLLPFDPKAELTELEEGAWFGAGQGLRKPERFPLGVPATVKDPEYREALEDLVGEDEEKLAVGRAEQAAARESALAILPKLQGHTLTPLEGGPLDLPARQLARLYRLATFTTRQALLGLRVRGPRAGKLAGAFEALPGVVARDDGDELTIGFPPDGRRSWVFRALEGLTAQGWGLLPSDSTFEFGTCSGFETDAPGAGLLRFSGRTRGQGADCVWEIREAFPQVSARVLGEALTLAAAAEDPRRLVLRSEEEAQQVLRRFNKHWPFMVAPGNEISRSGAEIRLAQDDPDALEAVAMTAFRHRHADGWPHEPETADEDEHGSEEDE